MNWHDPWMRRLSARQRVVILTFDSAAEAEAFDASDDTAAWAALAPQHPMRLDPEEMP